MTASVLGRALAVLGAFHAGDGELTLGELALRSGVPKTTVHRLVRELVVARLLERTAAGVRLGTAAFELGHRAPVPRDLSVAASPVLGRLVAATRLTAHVAVLDGDEVVYVLKLNGPDAPDTPSRTGGRLPARTTALGKAMLAATPGAAPPDRTLATSRAWHDDLERIRARGVAEDREGTARGVVCVAARVDDPAGHAVAAVSVSGAASRTDPRRAAPLVRSAAAAVSRALAAARPER